MSSNPSIGGSGGGDATNEPGKCGGGDATGENQNKSLAMSDVADDILMDILSRLPVEPLLRFRCVSPRWLALIDSPIFIKSHLNHSLKTNSNRILMLSSNERRSVDFDSLYFSTKLDLPSQRTGYSVLGSANGILCMTNFLWNLSTRRCHYFLDFKSSLGNIAGFGYDHLNDDYKVVTAVKVSMESQIRIYSLNSDSWLTITDVPYRFLPNKGYGACVSGALHWVVRSNKVYVICAFDLGTNEFRLVPQPHYLDVDFETNVGVLGGCLTILCSSHFGKVDIWVMKTYGVKESWTLLVSVSQPSDIPSFKCLRPLAYSNTGEKLLLQQDNNAFVWYDLRHKTFEKVKGRGLPKYFNAHICLGSLVEVRRAA